MKKTKRLAGALALAGGLFGVALATPASAVIVTQWSYSVASDFTAATYTGGGTTTPNMLSWGTPVGQPDQSSLVISNDPANGVGLQTLIGGGVPTMANIGVSNTLTHNNNVITGSSLSTATLTATVTLTPTASDLPPLPGGPPTQALNFNINFVETPNSTPCTSPSPPGNPCNDIFALAGGMLNGDFTLDGQQYFANIFPIAGGALTQLSNAECAAVGLGSGCLGFSTIEDQANSIQFGFTISTQRLSVVPEPGSMALIGTALFGLAMLRRRVRIH